MNNKGTFKKQTLTDIRDFPFQWDSDVEDLCTQNFWAKSGISRLSCILEKVCVHECLIVVEEFEANK